MYLKLLYIVYLTIVCIDGQTLNLNKGEICKGRGKKAWKCEHIKECPQIGDFKKKRPKICKFVGIEPIICCPPPPRRNSNSNNKKKNSALNLVSNGNAKKMCEQYASTRCLRTPIFRLRRQIQGTRVVFGGVSAKPKVHKFMALIGYGEAASKTWNCGGSLVSERWILSAAHCLSAPGFGPAKWARVGDLDISITTEDARPQEKMIVQRIVHPNYKSPAIYNDIALFKLDSDVALNSWVAPICLHTDKEIRPPKATVTGWGRLEFAADVSPHLQEVDITLVNGTECRRLHATSDNKIPRGIDPETMVCAGEKQGGKDACSGDSGGPLAIHTLSCLKSQIGITSFGKDCGLPNSPGVYTRVSHYIPWIESIVWPQI